MNLENFWSNLNQKNDRRIMNFEIYINISIYYSRDKWRVDLENFWSNQKMVVELSVVSKFWNDE